MPVYDFTAGHLDGNDENFPIIAAGFFWSSTSPRPAVSTRNMPGRRHCLISRRAPQRETNPHAAKHGMGIFHVRL